MRGFVSVVTAGVCALFGQFLSALEGRKTFQADMGGEGINGRLPPHHEDSAFVFLGFFGHPV